MPFPGAAFSACTRATSSRPAPSSSTSRKRRTDYLTAIKTVVTNIPSQYGADPLHEARAVHAVTHFGLMAKATDRPSTTKLAPKNSLIRALFYIGIQLYLYFL